MKEDRIVSMERWIRAIAGSFVLISLVLGYTYSAYWYWFTAFVGANLLQSAFTRWCLMENILEAAHIAQRDRDQSMSADRAEA
jgi:hypothetical protein